MSILNDEEIEARSRNEGMIHPFVNNNIRTKKTSPYAESEGIISYGLSSHGYDVRLAESLRVFTNLNGGIIDPKNLNQATLQEVPADEVDGSVIIPPNSYALGHTVETFDIPVDVMVVAVGKSTYARAGVIINVTPIEAGFKGQVVIEISNSTTLPVKVYVNEGIAQFLFFQSDHPCRTSYADKKGKYQGQTGITLPRI